MNKLIENYVVKKKPFTIIKDGSEVKSRYLECRLQLPKDGAMQTPTGSFFLYLNRVNQHCGGWYTGKWTYLTNVD